MTNEEAIKHLEFMAKGYQNLLDNDERCLEAVGKGYKGEVEAQESLADVYKTQIETLNVAIDALQAHKTGHWIRITQGRPGGEKYICSVCGRQIENNGIENLLPIRYPYCHCGAKMERIEDE